MSPRVDLTGERFGKLEVLEFAGSDKSRRSRWKCKCDCGVMPIVYGYHLTSGHSRSCGCNRSGRITHGHSTDKLYSREYSTWANMLQRCNNPNNPGYKWYGARGIKVCERWELDFMNFYRDMGTKPNNMSIERIDNNKGYSPENCKWATVAEQHANKRQGNQYMREGEL